MPPPMAHHTLNIGNLPFFPLTRNVSKVHECPRLMPWVNNWPISNLATFTNIFQHTAIGRNRWTIQNHLIMKYRSMVHIRTNIQSKSYLPKNGACSSKSIETIRRNHCIKKYRSLTYIYICRSNLMSHWINIFSPTFLNQNLFKICQNHWTIKCSSLIHIHFMWLIFASHGSNILIMTFVNQIVFKI